MTPRPDIRHMMVQLPPLQNGETVPTYIQRIFSEENMPDPDEASPLPVRRLIPHVINAFVAVAEPAHALATNNHPFATEETYRRIKTVFEASTLPEMPTSANEMDITNIQLTKEAQQHISAVLLETRRQVGIFDDDINEGKREAAKSQILAEEKNTRRIKFLSLVKNVTGIDLVSKRLQIMERAVDAYPLPQTNQELVTTLEEANTELYGNTIPQLAVLEHLAGLFLNVLAQLEFSPVIAISAILMATEQYYIEHAQTSETQ